jgi:hypothetical protein
MNKKKTIIFDPNAKTESFKRPNHPDFMTSSELKKIEFSGVRKNEHVLEWEFWILGEVRKTVHFTEVAKDQYALTRAHVELFQMTPDPKLFKR